MASSRPNVASILRERSIVNSEGGGSPLTPCLLCESEGECLVLATVQG
jgi:hypothetical protein